MIASIMLWIAFIWALVGLLLSFISIRRSKSLHTNLHRFSLISMMWFSFSKSEFSFLLKQYGLIVVAFPISVDPLGYKRRLGPVISLIMFDLELPGFFALTGSFVFHW